MKLAAVRWLGGCVAILLSANAGAQAWLPAEGSASVGVVFNDTDSFQHYLANGHTSGVGDTRTYTNSLAMSYAATSRILLAGTIPFVSSRYVGAFPHPGSVVDDGQFHTSATDLQLQLHYQVLEGSFALAPFMGLVVPIGNYPVLGHSARGRGLNEELLGFYAAKSLDQWLPLTYVQLKYTYAFVEQVAGVAHDRSNADFEIGYFPDPRWSVRALAYWEKTHGGINLPISAKSPIFPYHDQLVAERYVQIGAGAAWSATNRLNTYFVYKKSTSGANGHKVNDGLTVGFSYAFGRAAQ